MAADGNTDNFQGLVRYLNIWFFLNEFFSKKIHYKVLDLDFFHPLGMALRSKVKKIARNFKSETKVGKTSLKWATTKLFHHHLALNKVLLKKWY